MTDTTPRMALQELVASQAQKHVTVNDALIALDALMGLYVKGNGTTAPPTSPSDGDAYIVGASPTGDWSGYAGKIAYCIDGGWRFYAPFDGLQAYDVTASAPIIYMDGNWLDDVVTTTGTQTLTNKTCGNTLTLSPTDPSNPIALTVNRKTGSVSIDAKNTFIVNCSDGTGMQLQITGSEVARIGSDGSFLVGTTTNGGWSATAKIEAERTNGNAISGNIHTAGSALLARSDNVNASFLGCYFNATYVGSLYSSGTDLSLHGTSNIQLLGTSGITCQVGGTGGVSIGPGDTVWSAVSQRCLKRGFARITDAIKIINAHDVETWNYKTDAAGAKPRVGMMYEDAEKYWPVAAYATEGGEKRVAAADYVPLLMRAVQELDARLQALEAKAS